MIHIPTVSRLTLLRTCLSRTKLGEDLIGGVVQRPVKKTQTVYAAAFVVATSILLAERQRRPTLACSTTKLSPVQIMDITQMVSDQFSIPLVPSSIQNAIITEAVQVVAEAMEKKLTDQQMKLLVKALDGVSDGISEKEKDKIIDVLADSLEAVPVIPKSHRRDLVINIVDVMIGDVSVVGMAGGGAAGAAGGIMTATSLFDEAGRAKLVKDLNAKVDVPGLNESQEEVLLKTVVDALGELMEKIVPPEYQKQLKTCSKEEIAAFKQNVAMQLAARMAMIPFLPDTYKMQLIDVFVDNVFEIMLGASGLEDVVLTPALRLERLEVTLETTRNEMESAKRTAKRHEAGIQRRLTVLGKQKTELEKEVGSGRGWYIAALALVGVSVGGVACMSAAKK